MQVNYFFDGNLKRYSSAFQVKVKTGGEMETEAIRKIEGSYGEGGGQILRTALALSSLVQKPVEIEKIRAGRKDPGLRPQHLTSVQALREISQGKLEGAAPGSLRISFWPGKIKPGNYFFDVSRETRSAGSVSLVLQSLLPPLFSAGQFSRITLKGGTHVPFSPPVHYLQQVFAPLLERMGFKLKIDLKTWGFYPEGGGEIIAQVESSPRRQSFQMVRRDDFKTVRGISVAMNQSLNVAERQMRAASELLSAEGFRPEIEAAEIPAPAGRGSRSSFIFLRPVLAGGFGGFSALGEKGKPAEEVGAEAARRLIKFAQGRGALDPHIADQAIIYACLLPGKSEFTVTELTPHFLTNAWVIPQFLPVRIEIEGEKGTEGKVTVKPG